MKIILLMCERKETIIGKGGALVDIQNLNIMFGLDEKTGLDFYGIHPY